MRGWLERIFGGEDGESFCWDFRVIEGGAARERGAFFCWRRSVSEGGRCFSERGAESKAWRASCSQGAVREENGDFFRESREEVGKLLFG